MRMIFITNWRFYGVKVTDEVLDLMSKQEYKKVFELSQSLDTQEARNHFFLEARIGLIDMWVSRGFTKNLAEILVDHNILDTLQLKEAYDNNDLQYINKPYHIKQLRGYLRRHGFISTNNARLCNLAGQWSFCPKCGRAVGDH